MVRQIRAERIDLAVLRIVKDAARDPALVAEAVEEANRMAREQVGPLKLRVDQLRRELGDAERTARDLVMQALSAGIGTSAVVRGMIADAEERQGSLRVAMAKAEGELAVRETEQLDLEAVVAAIRGFDAAWEHLTLPEKRELLQLMIQEIVVRPEEVEVLLYEGRRATALLAASPSLAEAVKGGFVTGADWLPDGRQPAYLDAGGSGAEVPGG